MNITKRILSLMLCLVMVVIIGACSDADVDSIEKEEATQISADALKEKLDNKLDSMNFEGIVYITHNGSVVYQSATGEDEKGKPLTVDSPMFIGSVTKQFCATAVMMLKEQGKLSVDDTLDKYYPDYEYGKELTIKNLLTMRSGLAEIMFLEEPDADSSEEETLDSIIEGVLSQPLSFTPDSKSEYVNSNYILLGDIVEKVSGVNCNEFIRENIFKPLDMNDSGFASEVKESPEFSKGLTLETFAGGEVEALIAKGAGNIVSTAPDMEKWMAGLSGGKLISEESFAEMTTNYSPDSPSGYGYGLELSYRGGVSHTGRIGTYTAIDYINAEQGYHLFAVTNKTDDSIVQMPWRMLEDLLEE